jgi:hypothetical protein
MAILGPKNFRFGLRDPDFVEGMMFLTLRISMSNLNVLCDFYHDPNVGVNLPWSGYPGLHLNHTENPKVFGRSFKTL